VPSRFQLGGLNLSNSNRVRHLSAASRGIRVNGVAPGPVWTPLQISGGAPEEKYEKFGNTTVFGRPGQPAELASIYVQLAADDASFATGNIYGSGGGQGQP
jgi:NAD(P)-dependent dehydrogenase (short-subunit alcohol dehydrogenase family)